MLLGCLVRRQRWSKLDNVLLDLPGNDGLDSSLYLHRPTHLRNVAKRAISSVYCSSFDHADDLVWWLLRQPKDRCSLAPMDIVGVTGSLRHGGLGSY